MKISISRLVRNEKGQAAMELAIIMPIILLVLMFMIYVGILLFSKSALLMAAHAGGREGLQYWNVTSLTQQEKEQQIYQSTMEKLEALPRGEDSIIFVDDDQEGRITVSVTYFFRLNLPFLESITGYDAIPLRSTVTYRYTREEESW